MPFTVPPRREGQVRLNRFTSPTSILANLSIPLKVDLPGVGAHFQDQYVATFVYNNTITQNASDALTNIPTYAYVTASDIFGANISTVAATTRAKIPEYARLNVKSQGGGVDVAAEEELMKLRTDLIFDGGAPVGELLLEPMFAGFLLTLPLSSGSVHVSSYLVFDFASCAVSWSSLVPPTIVAHFPTLCKPT